MSFFDYNMFGVPNPRSAQAMSQSQIESYQLANAWAMRQAVFGPEYYRLTQNWTPPQRPLDERFADFKVRLAATVAKYPTLNSPAASG